MGIYTIKNNGAEQQFMGWNKTEERLKELTDLAVDNGYDVLEYQKMVQQAKERNYVDFDEWLSKIWYQKVGEDLEKYKIVITFEGISYF